MSIYTLIDGTSIKREKAPIFQRNKLDDYNRILAKFILLPREICFLGLGDATSVPSPPNHSSRFPPIWVGRSW